MSVPELEGLEAEADDEKHPGSRIGALAVKKGVGKLRRVNEHNES